MCRNRPGAVRPWIGLFGNTEQQGLALRRPPIESPVTSNLVRPYRTSTHGRRGERIHAKCASRRAPGRSSTGCSHPPITKRRGRQRLDIARYADSKGYAFQQERRYPYTYTYAIRRPGVQRGFASRPIRPQTIGLQLTFTATKTVRSRPSISTSAVASITSTTTLMIESTWSRAACWG